MEPATVMDPATWLRSFRTARGFATTVVCFPHAGGSAAYFRPLASALPPEIDVLAVQYPGRLDRLREPPVADAHQLADLVAAALRDKAGQPLAFFGHSMGAIVAFETARRLERSGQSPVLGLFASGRGAPGLQLHRVDAEDDTSLLAEIARLGGTDAQLLGSADMRSVFLPAIRADFRLLHAYRYLVGRLSCPVTAMVGDADPVTPVEAARAWGAYTTGEFHLRVFPGHHFYLSPCCTEVAMEIAGSVSVWEKRRRELARPGRQPA